MSLLAKNKEGIYSMNYSMEKLSEEKVFKDPVHRYIHVRDRVIWDLIGTREFQRLRRIKQLGTTYLTFHGAEHSRFNHSLGVYEIVRRIIDDVFQGRPQWDGSQRLLSLCAALLHDLGHGPFSHSYEKVFQLDHENFTREIILGDTEVNAILRRVDSEFPKNVAEVIAKTYRNKLVVSLISSQIDADRMDYLQRDAYYTGVSYGNFDMERLLRLMRPMEDQVVIKSSGMHAVEDYIMSRYQMYWQIYFHPVTRSAEVVLTKILHRAKELYFDEDYKFTVEPVHFRSLFEGKVTVEEYIAMDDNIAYFYFQQWEKEEDEILSDLCHRFVNRRLFQYTDCQLANEIGKIEELKQLFKKAGMDPDYYLVINSSSDLPYDFYRTGEEEERLPIHLLRNDGEVRELSRESEIVDAITGKRRTDHKLFFPEDRLRDETSYPEIKRQIRDLLGI